MIYNLIKIWELLLDFDKGFHKKIKITELYYNIIKTSQKFKKKKMLHLNMA